MEAGEASLDKIELKKLQAFLRRSLGNDDIRVSAETKNPDNGAVHLGERKIAEISVDDEDGDRSFAFEMKIPVGREVLQSYLRKLFENDRLTIVARGRKTDSVELNIDGEFLGVILPSGFHNEVRRLDDGCVCSRRHGEHCNQSTDVSSGGHP